MGQFEEITPRIEEERAPAPDFTEIHRTGNDVSAAATQFGDRPVDVVDPEAQMVPAMEAEGRVQVFGLGPVGGAGASDQFDLETVVVRRRHEGEGESHGLDAARMAEIEDIPVPVQSGVEIGDPKADMVAAHRFEG
nr:hypothetical protein [Azospirillum endophyticum]